MPRIVPAAWMPKVTMARVIMHWTAGVNKASEFDRGHYHILINDDGKLVRGIPVISGNAVIASQRKGQTAHHTLNCNTGSIGISLACMGGSQENPFKPGDWPMTRAQWDAMVLAIADLCEFYGIPVTPKTVLSHAEVQANLNIKQRGKWDFTRLAFDLSVRGAKACGDKARREVQAALSGRPLPVVGAVDGGDDPDGEPVEPIPTTRGTAPILIEGGNGTDEGVQGDPEIYSTQRRLKAMNYSPGGIDGVWGGKTAGAIAGFINDRGGHIAVPTTIEDFRDVYGELSDEIAQAESRNFVRPVTQARAEADPVTVARAAPETVPQKRNFWAGLWATITGAAALVFDTIKGWFSSAWDFWSDNKDALPQDKGILQTVWEHFTSIPSTVWIAAVVGLLAFMTYNAYRANKISTDGVRTGER